MSTGAVAYLWLLASALL